MAMVFSGAEVTTPRLWILWGMLLAGLRQGWWLVVETAGRQVIELDAASVIEPGDELPFSLSHSQGHQGLG